MQFVVLGAVPFIIGLLGYTGLWRRWANDGMDFWVLGFFWIGIGLFWIGASTSIPGTPSWLMFFGIGVLVVGASSVWYLPPPLTPKWFREARRAWRR